MNPFHAILLEIIVCGLIGTPVAYLFDPNGDFFYALRNLAHAEYIGVAWFCIAYAFAVMLVSYKVFRLGRLMAEYSERPHVILSRSTQVWLWWASFLIACVCLAVAIAQAGSHPILSVASNMDNTGVALLRKDVADTTNRNLLNVGLTIAMPLNLLLALATLRQPLLAVLSLGLYVALGTFTLEKSRLVMTLIQLAFFWMLWRPISLRNVRRVALFACCMVAAAGSMFWFTKYANTPEEIGRGLYSRLIYGTTSDLPYYFEAFADRPVSPTTMLPPYVRCLFDDGADPTAARRITLYGRPEQVRAGYAGDSNSFFVGEAYAVGGYPLVLLAPFVVMLDILIVIRLFRPMTKTLVTTYAQSLLLFLVFNNLFGSFGAFVFSSFHILLFVCLAARFRTDWAASRRARPREAGSPITPAGLARVAGRW
jgi:hypothetical protein